MGDKPLKRFVDRHLYDDQSPRAVSGRIKHHEDQLRYVSKNSIHRYISSVYGRRIEFFRTHRKQRRRRRGKHARLRNRTFIDKRPKYIEKRMRVGDMEADFIASGKSGKGILLVVVDRKTRATFLEQIRKITISRMHQAFLKIKERFSEMRTVTTDNDILFQKHEELEQLLNVRIYFCHPYHSWEKGTVENTNKYICRDIPKSSGISSFSRSFIEKLEEKLNRRIMACLKYRTPSEVLKEARRGRKKSKNKKRRHCV